MRQHTFNHARPDLAPYGFTCELWKGALMRRADRHNEIELNFMQRGSLTYLIGGNRFTLPARSLGAFWAALPHQIIGFTGSPQYFVVTLPLAWFLQCQLPAKLVVRLLAGQFLVELPLDRMELEVARCRQWQADLSQPAEPGGQAVILELHARLLRLAASLPDEPTGRTKSRAIAGTGGASKAEQMAGYIALHYREAVSVEEVARQVDLHPNYAMTLFKQTFRTTLNEYLTHYRIAQAQRLLATSEEKIVGIALDAGFRTPSRFYEAFRQACGCSPSRYRREHRVAG